MKITSTLDTSIPSIAQQNQQKSTDTSFADTLNDALRATNQASQASHKASMELATGQSTNIHEAMVTMQKSSVSVQFMVKATNKILEGYKELMRIA